MNYFELLNTNSAFEVDLAALEKAYFAVQRQYHPDRFAGKAEAERMTAMQRSVDANDAYNTLKDPLKRARYLLKLQDILVGTDQDTVKPSQALLMEVMEWREEGIDEALQADSIALISKHYSKQDWQAMAQETLRLGYINKTLQDMYRTETAL